MKKPIKTGTMLLAEPFMLDPNFKRAAILLVDHGEDGSIGFILNRESEVRIDHLVDDFPEFEAPVYIGGPVGRDTVHYLHRRGDLIEGSDPVARGIWWGGDYERLKFLIRQGLMTPSDVRFFVGYSGWSENQLEQEMVNGSWVPAAMDPNYVFRSPPDTLWSQVMHHKGNAFSVIADMKDEAKFN
ncbi:YqgE/AlgH family protein [Neolewinella aurantiaca]|uniref:YqgE/AlgH family protein n=1 Tax=Neolewinella aurantiaca TaxID=2602767 RepID=A0A5C7FBW4_9BACT|nr:YqgE/AlgH family protein [Neolewinella aurantiaca]TXF88393.1 YqgE/AlgH family protein [Neolewinella aurantiaca]